MCISASLTTSREGFLPRTKLRVKNYLLNASRNRSSSVLQETNYFDTAIGTAMILCTIQRCPISSIFDGRVGTLIEQMRYQFYLSPIYSYVERCADSKKKSQLVI